MPFPGGQALTFGFGPPSPAPNAGFASIGQTIVGTEKKAGKPRGAAHRRNSR